MPHGHIPLVLGHVPMQAFCLKTGFFQHFRQLVHLDLCITKDQAEFGLIILQQADACGIFILAFHLIVSLGNQRDCQFSGRNPDQPCILLEAVCYLQDRLGHSCREQSGLVLIGNLAQNQFHIFPKSHVQHFVCLVQHHHVHMIQLNGVTAHVIHHPSRGTHNNLCTLQSVNLFADFLSSVNGKYF